MLTYAHSPTYRPNTTIHAARGFGAGSGVGFSSFVAGTRTGGANDEGAPVALSTGSTKKKTGLLKIWNIKWSLKNIWQMMTGICQSTLTFDDDIDSVAFSPDGSKIAVVCRREMQIFDSETTAKLGSPLTVGIASVVFSPDGSKIAVAPYGTYNEIQLFDAETLAKLGSPLTVDKTVHALAFSPDGRKIAAAHGEEIQMFDGETHAKLGSSLKGDHEIIYVSFSPDGKILAAADRSYDKGQSVRLYDTVTGDVKSTNTSRVCQKMISVSFSPTGGVIAAGLNDFDDRNIHISYF
jgi:WD40 repeat protein